MSGPCTLFSLCSWQAALERPSFFQTCLCVSFLKGKLSDLFTFNFVFIFKGGNRGREVKWQSKSHTTSQWGERRIKALSPLPPILLGCAVHLLAPQLRVMVTAGRKPIKRKMPCNIKSLDRWKHLSWNHYFAPQIEACPFFKLAYESSRLWIPKFGAKFQPRLKLLQLK